MATRRIYLFHCLSCGRIYINIIRSGLSLNISQVLTLVRIQSLYLLVGSAHMVLDSCTCALHLVHHLVYCYFSQPNAKWLEQFVGDTDFTPVCTVIILLHTMPSAATKWQTEQAQTDRRTHTYIDAYLEELAEDADFPTLNDMFIGFPTGR